MALQLMFFVVLFLGLVKTPLAYDCLPDSSAGHPVLTGSHDKNTAPPCQVPPDVASEKEHCCIIDIDYGVSSAKYGATFQSYSTQPHQPDTVFVNTGLLSVGVPAYTLPLSGRIRSAAISTTHPTYLVTRRLRI